MFYFFYTTFVYFYNTEVICLELCFEKLNFNAKSNNFSVTEDEEWLFFYKETNDLPTQGWKIHMNSIIPHIDELISAVSNYCFSQELNWKILRSRKKLERAVYGGVSYPQTGKQITIYMKNDNELRLHIQRLNNLSKQFSGVVIPFDKKFDDNSCLYYRFGCFVPIIKYNKFNARKEYHLEINGDLKEDTKLRGYNPYNVKDPVIDLAKDEKSLSSHELKEIKVNGVLKQSGKGGVYKGIWKSKNVVVKEGRKNFQADEYGRTVIDRIENEKNVLDILNDTEVTPKVLHSFGIDGNKYIIIQYIEGKSLRDYVEQIHHFGEYEDLIKVVNNLIDALQMIHQNNIILRDLSPNNIIVRNDLSICIIDLENAYISTGNNPVFRAYTLGYVNPDFVEFNRNSIADDYYALGAILYYMATSFDPYFPGSTFSDLLIKLENYLDTFRNNDILYDIGKRGLQMMSSRKDFLSENFQFEEFDILNDGEEFVKYLIVKTDFNNDSFPLELDSVSKGFTNLSFNYGYSGIIFFLIEYYQLSPSLELKNYIDKFLIWCCDYAESNKLDLPSSLLFGIGYLPILLSKWAIITNNSYYSLLCRRNAESIIKKQSIQCDLSHGLAGIGIMLLRCYENSNDIYYLNESVKIYDQIMSRIDIRNNSLLWKTKHSDAKYNYFLGLAHGISGIGLFFILLYKHHPTLKNSQLIDNLINTLCDYKVTTSYGAYLWPHTIDSKKEDSWVFWCNGSTGVLWFLLFAYKNNYNQVKISRLLEGAISSIINSNVYGSTSICHGLAGTIEVLDTITKMDLRLFELKEIQEKRDLLIRRLQALRLKGENYSYWLGEDKETLQFSYMTGMSGIYSVLLKVKYNTDVTYFI